MDVTHKVNSLLGSIGVARDLQAPGSGLARPLCLELHRECVKLALHDAQGVILDVGRGGHCPRAGGELLLDKVLHAPDRSSARTRQLNPQLGAVILGMVVGDPMLEEKICQLLVFLKDIGEAFDAELR